jgi:hypothetical protein
VIYHSNNADPYSDTGIILEASPNTVISNNYIFMEHDYPRAIEYRFNETVDVKINNNATNKSISARDGGLAMQSRNRHDLASAEFFKKLDVALENHNISDVSARIDNIN